jgi:hypothetical protein
MAELLTGEFRLGGRAKPSLGLRAALAYIDLMRISDQQA